MRRNERHPQPEGDAFWYKDAIIYELHVRAFSDSSADGVGDFRGLTDKLGYLEELGVTALWLLPFYPSPLRDDGYDISNYTEVHADYGTIHDFDVFLEAAHRRGMKVITEMVLNHTSDQHAWFQRSRRAPPDGAWRKFYVWSETADRYRQAPIIFRDFESSNWAWDRLGNAYYWHRFYAHQPDLNYENPLVRRSMMKVIDFWLGRGVDGLRLDAVPYLYEREGTTCEDLPETHAFLKDLRGHVDARFRNRMLLAEANLWPEDAAAYFGGGDECHMAFHFPLMPRLFLASRMEDRFPIVEVLRQTPAIPESCQWALFLRNHDELTLALATDEERDYMYRVYAQDPRARVNSGIRRRLAPLLENDRRKIELMYGLLFSLPGTPVVYYGDEIGMGDNFHLGDRNGVRTPMQWSSDRNAGFSQARPQQLYLPVNIDPEHHYEAVNVDIQQNSPHSLLWWVKRLITLRKQHPAFGRGSLEFLYPDNRRVLAYIRRWEDECILVVNNLSRLAQPAELDLSEFKGVVPVELFGRTEFTRVSEKPYLITLGPHAFYWFSLCAARPADTLVVRSLESMPLIHAARVSDLAGSEAREDLERILPAYLNSTPWFQRERAIRFVLVRDVIPIRRAQGVVALVRVEFLDGESEDYLVPLAGVPSAEAGPLLEPQPDRIVARLAGPNDGTQFLSSRWWVPPLVESLVDVMAAKRRLKGEAGEVQGFRTRQFQLPDHLPAADATAAPAEATNWVVHYGDRFLLKLYRHVEPGIHPEVEVGRYLAARPSFGLVPGLLGWIEYRSRTGETTTLGVLHRLEHYHADGWTYTLESLGPYVDRAIAAGGAAHGTDIQASLLADVERDIPAEAGEVMGVYLEWARLLGERTAELHNAISADRIDPAFAPEPFSEDYRKGRYHRMLSGVGRSFQLLRRRIGSLEEPVRQEAQRVLEAEDAVRRQIRRIRDIQVAAERIRCHGHYHLGQILYTGKDFLIVDFEGSPLRPLSERRIKHSPLRDVASMLRSFHYASEAASLGHVAGVSSGEQRLAPWMDFWRHWASAAFLKGYLSAAPQKREQITTLLDIYLLEEAIDELERQLRRRPAWAIVPLRAILELAAGYPERVE